MTLDQVVKDAMNELVQQVLSDLRASGQLGAAAGPAPFDEPDTKPFILTVERVAELCGGVSAETVRGWIHRKRLRASKPGRRFLVHPDDLKRFLEHELAAPYRERLVAVDSPHHLDRVLFRLKGARAR